MEDIDQVVKGLTILRRYVGGIPCPIIAQDDLVRVSLDEDLPISKEDHIKLRHMGWWEDQAKEWDGITWLWG